MSNHDNADIMRRAFAAYFRTPTYPEIPTQPSESLSGVEKHNGLEYAVLRNNSGLLAVYRVTNAGQLKRLKRWPKEFGAA